MKVTATTTESITRWPPAASSGGLIGVLGTVLSVSLAGLSLLTATGQISFHLPRVIPVILLILFAALGCAFGYLVYGYNSIGYELSADQLVIRWAGQRHIIPLGAIQQIVPAVERLGSQPERWQKFWPGYYVGSLPSLTGLVTVVATLKVRRQLMIVTRDRQFSISPERPVLFLEAYAQLRRAFDLQHSGTADTLDPGELTARFADAGWTVEVPTINRTSSITASPEYPERLASSPRPPDMDVIEPNEQRRTKSARANYVIDSLSIGLIVGAVVVNIVIMLLIFARYHGFPGSLVLHWNVDGVPDRYGSTRQIWIIPVITWLVTIGNVVLAWAVDAVDRFATRFLLAATLVIQLMAVIALYMLIR